MLDATKLTDDELAILLAGVRRLHGEPKARLIRDRLEGEIERRGNRLEYTLVPSEPKRAVGIRDSCAVERGG